ncbi:SMR family transporter [Microvirga sp. W0021]|uniref:Spermidine export protein MdtI n=1 Tax=Hohaiivirga grylli TaxID=3133970 RepID=A0ABV0BJE9_9HYPH
MSLTPLLFVTGSAFIDILANMMIAKSQGFRKLRWGIAGIFLIWIAFAILSQAVKTMDIAIAYAMWGAIGVTGTALCGRLIFGNKLRPIGWAGIGLVTSAVVVLSVG